MSTIALYLIPPLIFEFSFQFNFHKLFRCGWVGNENLYSFQAASSLSQNGRRRMPAQLPAGSHTHLPDDSSLTWAKPSPSWPDSLSTPCGSSKCLGGSVAIVGGRRPHVHRRHHGRIPCVVESRGSPSPSWPADTIMAPRGSPSPSWPVPLSQTSCGFS